MKKLLLAGLLGGVALFAWESIAHLALPLGDAGIKTITGEQAVVASLKDNIKEAGFYFFPAPQNPPAQGTGYTGIMVVQPNGTLTMAPGQLITQLLVDMLTMLVAAILLSRAGLRGFGKRLFFVTLMGLLPTLGVDIPQWNWYAFPAVYALAQAVVHLGGFAAGGLVLAKVIQTTTLATKETRQAAA